MEEVTILTVPHDLSMEDWVEKQRKVTELSGDRYRWYPLLNREEYSLLVNVPPSQLPLRLWLELIKGDVPPHAQVHDHLVRVRYLSPQDLEAEHPEAEQPEAEQPKAEQPEADKPKAECVPPLSLSKAVTYHHENHKEITYRAELQLVAVRRHDDTTSSLAQRLAELAPTYPYVWEHWREKVWLSTQDPTDLVWQFEVVQLFISEAMDDHGHDRGDTVRELSTCIENVCPIALDLRVTLSTV